MHLNGGGYTFIQRNDLNILTNDDVQAMFSDKKSFLMRVRKPVNRQPYAVLSQLPKYKYVCAYDCLGLTENALQIGPSISRPSFSRPAFSAPPLSLSISLTDGFRHVNWTSAPSKQFWQDTRMMCYGFLIATVCICIVINLYNPNLVFAKIKITSQIESAKNMYIGHCLRMHIDD